VRPSSRGARPVATHLATTHSATGIGSTPPSCLTLCTAYCRALTPACPSLRLVFHAKLDQWMPQTNVELLDGQIGGHVEPSPPLMRLCFFTENDTRALVMSSCLGVRATPVADPCLKTCGAKLVDFKLINTIYSAYSSVQYAC
jgi:hypothetical protein